MNSYARFINELYEVLSGTWGDHFIGIDETLEEVPPSAEYVIRPSFNFGTTTSMSNLRDIENDVIVNLQLFKAHGSQVDIVEQAEMIRSRLLHVTVFTIDDQKYWTTYRNLVKNFDSKYTGVTVQILAKKYEEVQETPIDWTTRPLTFIAAEPNTKIIFRRYGTGIISTLIKYKFNIDDEWQNYTPGDEIILEKVGDMVMFENTASTRLSYDTVNYFNVESTGSFYARGQINSLTNYTSQPGGNAFFHLFEKCDGLLSMPLITYNKSYNSSFNSMFYSCSNLVEVEDINVKEVVGDYPFFKMFYQCTSLKKAPKINCTTYINGSHSFDAMFFGCSNLTEAPELPLTTINQYFYYQMFANCYNLKEAPELPATTLSAYCYQSMFQNCTKLKKAPQLNFVNAPNYCCQNMFNGCEELVEGPSALLANDVEIGSYDGMFQNCKKLVKAPEIHASSFGQYGCRSMFNGCTSMVTGPSNLSGSIAGLYACQSMFAGCTSLSSAPLLQSTTLTNNCYYQMFYGCTSLTESPILPALELLPNCYQGMFSNCTNLVKAGEIKATTLNSASMNSMFAYCTKLSDVTVNFTAWNPTNATSNWMLYVPGTSDRVFRCPSSLPNIRGVNNIPVNWTKVDI